MSIAAARRRQKRMAYFREKLAGGIEAIHPTTGEIITVDPQVDAMIGDNLDKELRRLPGLLSWYLSLRDVAHAALKRAKHEELSVAEDLSYEIRTTAEEEGTKLKESEIRVRIKTHKRMRKAFRRRMRADAMVQRLESAVTAITEKKWMLRALVDHKKLELYVPDGL